MPFLDRYWWLRPVLAAAILLVPSQPLNMLVESGFIRDLVNMPSDHIGDILLFGGLTLLYLAMASLVAASTLPARRRKLHRIAAILGHADAIPRALVVYPHVNFDLAEKPIVIQEQYSKGTRWMFILLAFPLVLFCLAAVIAFEILLTIFTISNLSVGSVTLGDILRSLLLVGLGAVTVWGVITLSRYLPTIFGRPYGVTFGPDGVSYRSDVGRQIFLRWDEMRLFEASGTPQFGHISPPYEYRLYGLRKSVHWRDILVYPTADAIPTPENTRDGQSLAVTIIRDRTGLPPRTFVKQLQAREQPSAASPVA